MMSKYHIEFSVYMIPAISLLLHFLGVYVELVIDALKGFKEDETL